MSSSLSVFMYSINIVDNFFTQVLITIIVGDKGRLGLVQIVQWIKFVCVMYMFSME